MLYVRIFINAWVLAIIGDIGEIRKWVVVVVEGGGGGGGAMWYCKARSNKANNWRVGIFYLQNSVLRDYMSLVHVCMCL